MDRTCAEMHEFPWFARRSGYLWIRPSAKQFSFKTIIRNQLPGHLKKKLFSRWAEKLFLQKQLSGINPRALEKEIVLMIFESKQIFLHRQFSLKSAPSHLEKEILILFRNKLYRETIGVAIGDTIGMAIVVMIGLNA